MMIFVEISIHILSGLVILGQIVRFLGSQTGISICLLIASWGIIIYMGFEETLSRINKNQMLVGFLIAWLCVEFFTPYLGAFLFGCGYMYIVHKEKRMSHTLGARFLKKIWEWKYCSLCACFIAFFIWLIGTMPHLFGF